VINLWFYDDLKIVFKTILNIRIDFEYENSIENSSMMSHIAKGC